MTLNDYLRIHPKRGLAGVGVCIPVEYRSPGIEAEMVIDSLEAVGGGTPGFCLQLRRPADVDGPTVPLAPVRRGDLLAWEVA